MYSATQTTTNTLDFDSNLAANEISAYDYKHRKHDWTSVRSSTADTSITGRKLSMTNTSVSAGALHAAAIQNKVEKWRKRDAFFTQRGALTSLIRNKCLDSGGGIWTEHSLRMMNCHDTVTANQRFVMKNGALVQIRGDHRASSHHLCVTVSEKGSLTTHSGTLVVTAPCEDSRGQPSVQQRWTFKPVPSMQKQYGFLQSGTKGGGCLTKPPVGRGTSRFATVVLQPCAGWCNQTWSFGDNVSVARDTAWRPRVNGGRGAGRVLCWYVAS